jgi:hypothetical protein
MTPAQNRDGFALVDEAFEFCCGRHEASPFMSTCHGLSLRCALRGQFRGPASVPT